MPDEKKTKLTVEAPAMVVPPAVEPAKVGDKNIAPLTTAAEDMVQAGQRRINLIWEFTQTFIAGTVVTTILIVSAKMVFAALGTAATEKQVAFANLAFIFLSGVANLVIGFYFGRTNHQRTGGLGTPPGNTR